MFIAWPDSKCLQCKSPFSYFGLWHLTYLCWIIHWFKNFAAYTKFRFEYFEAKSSLSVSIHILTILQYGFALQVWKGQGFKLSQRNNLSLPGNWIYVVFLTDVTTRPVHTGQKYEKSAMKNVVPLVPQRLKSDKHSLRLVFGYLFMMFFEA